MTYCENKEFSKEGYHRPVRVITELVKNKTDVLFFGF